MSITPNDLYDIPDLPDEDGHDHDGAEGPPVDLELTDDEIKGADQP